MSRSDMLNDMMMMVADPSCATGTRVFWQTCALVRIYLKTYLKIPLLFRNEI